MSRRPTGWRGIADLTSSRLDWTGASDRAPGPIGFALDDLSRAAIPGHRAPWVPYDFTLRDGRFLSFGSMDDEPVREWLEAASFQILISPARPEFATVLPPGEAFEWADIGR
jgi:hypothetical protein